MSHFEENGLQEVLPLQTMSSYKYYNLGMHYEMSNELSKLVKSLFELFIGKYTVFQIPKQ